MNCDRCGSDHVELGSLMVARETQTVSGGGVWAVGGTSRAEALTADKPRVPTKLFWNVLLIAAICILPCGGLCLSSMIIIASTGPDPYTGSQIGDVGQVPLLFLSLLAIVVIVVVGTIFNILARRRYRSRHQAWAIKFNSRYYCHNCGKIFQS